MKSISKMTKIFAVNCVLMLFFLSSFSSASAGKGGIDVKFEGQIMSAELQGVSLKVILEKFKREKGIWFKGDEALLEEKVSVRFKDLPLQEGLSRILSWVNHTLVFDQDKRLVGLFILGKKNPTRPVAQNAAMVSEKALPSQPVKEPKVSRNPFEIFADVPSPGNPKRKSTDTTIGKKFSPSENQMTEMSDTTLMDLSPWPESAHDESMSPWPENPFGENVFPAPENPFDDPFGSSLNPQKGEGL